MQMTKGEKHPHMNNLVYGRRSAPSAASSDPVVQPFLYSVLIERLALWLLTVFNSKCMAQRVACPASQRLLRANTNPVSGPVDFEIICLDVGPQKEIEIISTLLRRIGIPPPTVPPGESFV